MPSKSLYFMQDSTSNHIFKKPIIDFKKANFNATSLNLQIYNPTMGLYERHIYLSDSQYEKSDKMILNYTVVNEDCKCPLKKLFNIIEESKC